MNEKISITKVDGTKVEADIICLIENVTNGKRYVYYTLNEITGAGANSTVKVYVAKLQQNNPTLDTPITEEDWDKLKGYMGDALKGTTNAEIKYIPVSELVSPVSINERAIAMPTSYDYINKQRGIYASSVAVGNVVPPTPSDAPLSMEAPLEPTPAPGPVQEPTPEPAPIIPEVTPTPEVTPAPETPSTPVTPVPEPAPEVPTVEPVQVQAPEPVTPVVPVQEPVQTPVTPEPVVETVPAPTIESGNTVTSTTLEPIDIAMIEQKYNEMIENINKLKEQELEAAKRYNATIELSSMHKEQHANYIQNEQIKEGAVTPDPTVVAEQAPVSESVAPVPPTPPAVDLGVNPAPIVGAPIIDTPAVEPTPVTPIVPEPVAATPTNLETNWFDMPANSVQ